MWTVLGSGNGKIHFHSIPSFSQAYVLSYLITDTADRSCQLQDHSSAPSFSLSITHVENEISLGVCSVLGIEITGGTPP